MIDRKQTQQANALSRFTHTAEAVSSDVIGSYSTSFGLSSRLLGRRHRRHVRNIYALVRVADEIVDGVASEAGLDLGEQRDALDRYEADTHRALRTGYSTDLVIHAFARSARLAGIDESLTRPFFDSMRADLAASASTQAVFDEVAHAKYVYGSAEVVGLMCLRVFIRDQPLQADDVQRLEHGARQLGAAFQNINFLRDLRDDTARLGRSYLGNRDRLTDQDLSQWIAEIRAQLADAKQTLTLLPRDARAAVRSALALFETLTNRVAKTAAADLYRRRIRVPNAVKLWLVTRAVIATRLEGEK